MRTIEDISITIQIETLETLGAVLQHLVGTTIASLAANKHQTLLLPTHNKQPISCHSISWSGPP